MAMGGALLQDASTRRDGDRTREGGGDRRAGKARQAAPDRRFATNPAGSVPAHRSGSRAVGEPGPCSGRGKALRGKRRRSKGARGDADPGEDRAGGSRLRSRPADEKRSKGFGAGPAARSGLKSSMVPTKHLQPNRREAQGNQNSICAPSSTTLLGGIPKNSVAGREFRCMKMKSRLRQRASGFVPVGMRFSRPR